MRSTLLYYTSCKHPSKRPVNCKPKSLDRSVWFSPKKNQTLTNYRIQETKSVWGATTVRGPQSSSVGTSIAWRRSFNKCFCSWMTLETLVTCQDSVHNSSASVMIWVTKSVDFSWESLHYKVTLVADDTRASISVWRFWRQTVSSWCFKSCYYYRQCQLVNSESRRFISKSSAMRRAKVWLVHPHRFCPTIFLPRFHSLNNRFNPKGERTADVKNADKQLLPCRYPTLRQMARLVLNHTETTNYRYTSNPL